MGEHIYMVEMNACMTVLMAVAMGAGEQVRHEDWVIRNKFNCGLKSLQMTKQATMFEKFHYIFKKHKRSVAL